MMRLDLEEILRRELHAAAESIEPAADGLTQIRARLSMPRPLPMAWLMVAWTSALQPTLLRMDQALVAFGDFLRAIARPVTGPLQPAIQPALGKARSLLTPRTESGSRPSGYAWLRPALVMAAVVAVAVAGGFALSGLPRQIQQAANSILSNPTTHTKHGGPGSGLNGSGSPVPTPGTVRPTSAPSPSCSPSPKHKVKPSPSTSPSPTPTPTPSPSVTPSPSPSVTPSPSPSDSASSDNPAGSSSPDSQTASDTSDLILTSAFHPDSTAKTHPSPSPSSCSGSSG